VSESLDLNILELKEKEIKKLVKTFAKTYLGSINSKVTEIFINYKRDLS